MELDKVDSPGVFVLFGSVQPQMMPEGLLL